MKARWRRARASRKRDRTLEFDELFERIRDNETLGSIADAVGLSKARLGQLYNKYFKVFFGNRSGNDRIPDCIAKRRALRRHSAERDMLLRDRLMGLVFERARTAGCTVETIPLQSAKGSGAVSSSMFYANGHLCSLRRITSQTRVHPRTRRGYAHTSVHPDILTRVDALIIASAVPGCPRRVFVIPIAVYRERYRAAHPERPISLYVPTKKLPAYHGIRQAVDYWQFENAWHLLPPQERATSP